MQPADCVNETVKHNIMANLQFPTLYCDQLNTCIFRNAIHYSVDEFNAQTLSFFIECEV